MANEPVANENQPQYGQLGIQKIYVKDLSFEAPNSPKIFTEQVNPTVDIHFANNTQALGPDVHEVVLTVTANVKQGDKSIYLIEVQQGGVFSISGFPAEHLPAILATACPNILFPFAREAICDVVTKGGFPQLLLAPVNFEMLYAQELQRRQAEAAGQGETPAH